VTELELLGRDVHLMRDDVTRIRREHERLHETVYGSQSGIGLDHTVKEIAVILKSLENMVRLVTYIAVPLGVLSLLISFAAVVISVIALGKVP